MPAPRRPWPPSRPSRPPSLHESACERASRPQLPSPSSSRDPSRLTVCGTRTRRERSSPGKSSSTWRAPGEKMLRVRLRRGAAAASWGCGVEHGGALAMEARAGGAGEKSKRRRRRAQAAAQARTGGAGRARGRGGGGSTCRRAAASGGGAGQRRRCGETAAARREGDGGSRWMRAKQRGRKPGVRGQDTYMTGGPAIFFNTG